MAIKLNQTKSSNPVIKLQDATPGKFYISVSTGGGAEPYTNKVGVCSTNTAGFNKLQLIDDEDYVANNSWLVQELESVDINYSV